MAVAYGNPRKPPSSFEANRDFSWSLRTARSPLRVKTRHAGRQPAWQHHLQYRTPPLTDTSRISWPRRPKHDGPSSSALGARTISTAGASAQGYPAHRRAKAFMGRRSAASSICAAMAARPRLSRGNSSAGSWLSPSRWIELSKPQCGRLTNQPPENTHRVPNN
jgi:hypothetical protein